MREKHLIWYIGCVAIILLIVGCFPSKKVVTIEPESLSTDKIVTAPTKAYLFDNSIILLPDGFLVRNDSLVGIGSRHWLNRFETESRYVISLDSIAAMNYYEKTITGGTVAGTISLGILGAILTPISIYCISCPKCCFGSCPTVYTKEGEDYFLEAELFSYSLSRYFQELDVDKLAISDNTDGDFSLRLTNEALETHYINQLNLLSVDHPVGTEVFPTPDGHIMSVGRLQAADEARNSNGRNVLEAIREQDEMWYRSDTTYHDPQPKTDWIDLDVKIPGANQTVKMVLRLRNTLLTTILFYDVVLASQGVEALEWTQALNTDPLYASLYHSIYNEYAGIKVKVYKESEWVKAANIGDVGPLAWKEVVVELPALVDETGTMSIRLESFPDNFMIDYVSFDLSPAPDSVQINEISPKEIQSHNGVDSIEVQNMISDDDDKFLITNPGESFYLAYELPDQESRKRSIFLKSKGYYTEWLRGSWITAKSSGYKFNLFDIEETIGQLQESWRKNRDLMEKTFFETRIPLKED